MIWGGAEGCQHEWEDRAFRDRRHTPGAGPKQASNTGSDGWRSDPRRADHCLRCGAWRGSLGGEPLHDCLAWARGEPPCPVCYVCHLRTIWARLWRVLRKDGTCWLVIGDSQASDAKWGGSTGGMHAAELHGDTGIGRRRRYTGLKPKDLCGIPWRVALALQADGWYLRRDIIWAKPNPMPESVTDRPTRAHEYVLLLSKAERYYYDREAVLEPSVTQDPRRPYTSSGAWDLDGRPESQHHGGQPRSSLPACYKGSAFDCGKTADHQLGRAQAGARQEIMGRNLRDVWTVATVSYKGAHFATFPPKLVEPMILAGTSERGCCPKCGAPWTRITESSHPHPSLRAVYSEDSSKHLAADRNSGQRRLAVSTTAGRKATGSHDAPFQTAFTVGWRPSCECLVQDPVPCTVLDPFAGSGTAGAVALRLGRSFIGIELNPQYIALARRRIAESIAKRKAK